MTYSEDSSLPTPSVGGPIRARHGLIRQSHQKRVYDQDDLEDMKEMETESLVIKQTRRKASL